MSTVVHSHTIPPKEQPTVANSRERQNYQESCSRSTRDNDGLLSSSRTLQPPSIQQVRPGKVTGSVLPYENGNAPKFSYDPRALVKSTVLSPQTIASAYCYNRDGSRKMEKSVGETRGDFSSNTKQISNCSIAAPDIAIDIDTNPYCMGQAGGTMLGHGDDGVVIDMNLLQAEAQYGLGVGAAAASNLAAHRKVAMLQ